MAEVIGFLREDATYGEKETLKLLSRNLPKEFTVYVDSPIYRKLDRRSDLGLIGFSNNGRKG